MLFFANLIAVLVLYTFHRHVLIKRKQRFIYKYEQITVEVSFHRQIRRPNVGPVECNFVKTLSTETCHVKTAAEHKTPLHLDAGGG